MARTWRIGEVAERTGLTRRTLRHYDALGLLVPSSRSWGDYRLYDEADLLRLLQVQNLKALGLSLAEIAVALDDPDLDAGATLRSHLGHLEERIQAEQNLAGRLRALVGSPERSWDDVLDAIAATRRLAHPDPTVRLRTALQSPGSTSELLEALAAESDPAVQEVLVWSLAQRPDAASSALERLTVADSAQKCVLVRLLGKIGDPATVPALVPLLADPEPAVVASTVRALAGLAAPEPAAALVGLLGSPAVAEADLLDAIAATGVAALEPLAEGLAAVEPRVRAAAAEALGRVDVDPSGEAGGRLRALLQDRLVDPDRGVRLAALLALGEQGPAARAAIEAALDDASLAPVARRLLDLHAT